jgi:hypothetical protein
VPLNKNNTRTFHRTLYAGQLETVTLLKRDDDQRQGVVRSVKLFECRWSAIAKTGETYDGDMVSDHRRQLHIPRIIMDRAGVNYINPADRFVDKEGRTWCPESTEVIDIKLFENHICVMCQRLKN